MILKVKTGILEKKLNELKLNEMTPTELEEIIRENIEVVLIQKRPYRKEVTEGTTIDVVVNKIEKKTYTVTLHYTLETEDENSTNTIKKTNVVILAGSTELTTTKGSDGEYTAKYTGQDGTTFKVKVDGAEVATKKITKSELEEYDKNDIYLN